MPAVTSPVEIVAVIGTGIILAFTSQDKTFPSNGDSNLRRTLILLAMWPLAPLINSDSDILGGRWIERSAGTISTDNCRMVEQLEAGGGRLLKEVYHIPD